MIILSDSTYVLTNRLNNLTVFIYGCLMSSQVYP